MDALPSTRVVRLEWRASCLLATLDDAATNNALSATMVEDLQRIIDATSESQSVRALIIQGREGIFCAGGNLKGTMGATAEDGAPDPVREENRRGGRLFHALNRYPAPVIALVDGAAMGGGFGLACCADIVITTARAQFALSETRLGLVPAQIAPFVVARIGLRTARRLALTGARLDSEAAVAIGLSDFHCADVEQARIKLNTLLQDILRCGPRANAATKALLLDVAQQIPDTVIDRAADIFTACLRGSEGQEGIAAFVQKRKPAWTEAP
jgi:isohexenylglutaconyl-CoA hydratase